MLDPPPVIAPCRSLIFFALLAILMVVTSYALIALLAFACVYVPWLIVVNAGNFQTLALLVAGIVVSISLLWSLVPRRAKFAAPGLLLDRNTHPRLFRELDGIAAALREPIPSEVYLIGDANAWVADRGGVMGFGSRRIMGLGIPLLAAMDISQFRAVLAHEFAHYYGGDTRLGPWVYRSQKAMIRSFESMGAISRAMRFPVMQFLYIAVFGILKWYWQVFLRAISFVARRQEFRADELACMVAGRQALASGLRVLHGAALAWPAYWKSEMSPMLNSGFLPPITEGFAQFLASPKIADQVTSGVERALHAGRVHAYNSHPPLRDRIQAAKAMPNQPFAYEPQSAWCLLSDSEGTEQLFVQMLLPDAKRIELKRVSWNDQATRVVIPSWSSLVGQYAHLLQGIVVDELFDALSRVPQIAPQIRDPEGMLLTPQQRIDRTRMLIAQAVGILLIQHGWRLHSLPGEFHLERGDQKLDPFELIFKLSNGEFTKEQWQAKCLEMGIQRLSLVELSNTAQVVSKA